MKAFLTMTFLTISLMAQGSPVGEKSKLILTKEDNRSTSMISEGKSEFSIVAFDEEKSEYQVDWTYSVKVGFYGNQNGTITFKFPKKVIEGKLQDTAVDQELSTSNLDIKVLETGLDLEHKGKSYKNATKIKLIVKQDKMIEHFEDLLLMEYASEYAPKGIPFDVDVKNVTATAIIHPSVPAVGVVKLDIKGEVYKYKIKMGFDL